MAEKYNKVKWIVKDKGLIKFQGDDATYNLAEGLDGDKIENGCDVTGVVIAERIVTAIAVAGAKAEPKKEVVKEDPKKDDKKAEEKPVETKKEEVTEEKPAKEIKPVTWEISALSFDNAVVKFAEQETEKYWYPIASGALKVFKELRKGDKVQIVIDKMDAETKAGELYVKDGVVNAKSVVKKEEAKAEEKKVEPEAKKEPGKSKSVEEGTRKAYANTTNDSIERQVALKEAGAIVRSLIETDPAKDLSLEKIEKIVDKLTKSCLDALRNA